MDERGAVNRARGELERRRQEAYRARAAATIKIQRWYREHKAIRARPSTNGDASLQHNPLELPAEESRSGSTSTSATLITISQEEIQGISPMVSNDRESISDSDDNPVRNRNAWSSSSQLEERSSSFDEFVNSEVAVARAMVDERYMNNLNDAQKKRVKRLKAYRKISGDQIAASETLQNESSNVSIGASLPSNSSNITKVINEDIPGHKPIDVSKKEIQSAGKTKSLIPVKTTKKPLPNLRKRGIKPDMVKKVETQNKPQTTTKVEPIILQDVNAQVPNRRSKQNLSKPTSNQKKQWTVKEQHVVQKQQQTKEHRRIEQSDPIDQAAKDDTRAEPVMGIKDLVKIGGKGEVVCVNDTNMQKEEGDITGERIHVMSSSSSERGAQASKGTQTGGVGAHTEKEYAIKLRLKGQQTGQKVLKFASNVMWQNSNSTGHEPSTEHSDTMLRGIVKQPPNLIAAEMDRSEQKEELPLLKKSSAVTRLTLECETEDEIQSDSAPVLKQISRHKNTDESCSDSDSFLNLGRLRSSHPSLNKRSTNARRQRIINAALATTDDSNSDDSSPEHLAYAGSGQPRATRVSHGGTKFASQGGGYGAIYAKRRDTNRKRIIRSLRTPQCKPKEKKDSESPGYLKKFLRSSMAQNYLEALTTSSAAPSYSSGKGSWHTAWTSMGGLPRPGVGGLRTPPEHSPPPQEWISVMSHASSISLLEGSHDSPLVLHPHHLARRPRRPHHLHPLNAAPAAGSKLPRTTKAGHPRSYTYHYNQQRQLGNHSQTHRRSRSHVIPSSWRTELYYEPDNRYRGGF